MQATRRRGECPQHNDGNLWKTHSSHHIQWERLKDPPTSAPKIWKKTVLISLATEKTDPPLVPDQVKFITNLET